MNLIDLKIDEYAQRKSEILNLTLEILSTYIMRATNQCIKDIPQNKCDFIHKNCTVKSTGENTYDIIDSFGRKIFSATKEGMNIPEGSYDVVFEKGILKLYPL